ncbi:hypothetical protein TNCV_2986921 [Trichonephila clavipes]|nr:hypothetical protein TNCV_2986921 [Trichonephila clavipes]
MIVYDVEDEIESNPDYVKKKMKYYKTFKVFNKCLAQFSQNWFAPITPKLTHSPVNRLVISSGVSNTGSFGIPKTVALG